MSNNICNNPAYINSLDQKKRFQLFNIPPVRYNNLASNPYDSINPSTGVRFTQFDLDMRRKAEILQYSSNRMTTQTNSLTKAQKFVQAVTGSYKSRTYSQTYLNENTVNGVLISCPMVKKSSTASNVPGPPILLYEDPNVPLYNLTQDTNNSAFGFLNQPPGTTIWNNTFNTNVPIKNNTVYSTITTVYILNPDSPSYLFNISTPVSLVVSGSLISNQSYNDDPEGLRITLNRARVNVLYSNTNVPLQSFTCEFSQTPNVTISNINLSPNSNTYTATCYLGLLNISNLELPVEKGFIYDIQIAISYIFTSSNAYNTKCTAPTITSTANATYTFTETPSTNCSVISSVIIPPANLFPTLHISGRSA
jgi:hypothetical protein